MLINDLPDDCLLTIFGHTNIRYFEDFVRISKVCSRWKNLISQHLRKVKYLLQDQKMANHMLMIPRYYEPLKGNIKNSSDTLLLRNKSQIKDFEAYGLLSNLKILDARHLSYEKVEKILNDNPSIVGLISYDLKFFAEMRNTEEISMKIYDQTFYKEPIDLSEYPSIASNLGKMTMFATNCWSPCYDRFYSDKLTQLHLHHRFSPWLIEKVKFINLQRLHIEYFYDIVEFADEPFTGPLLPELKIFEFSSHSEDYTFKGFLLLDNFPSLESAFLSLDTRNYDLDRSKKNANLRDLVIEEADSMFKLKYSLHWNGLRNLLAKFPNLKNFAIRGNVFVHDDNVQEIINLCPSIELMDFRRSPKVTRKSADYLDEYCKQTGRSIKFYFDCSGDEPSDWHKLDDSNDVVCSGFDFMKNCFFKRFDQLPYFLDP